MIRQRPADAAPIVRARAEALPLRDRAVDATLAVLTVHHWTDPAAGLAELVRVSDRQVVVTWDPAHLARSFWLVADYLPEIADHEAGLACLDRITAELRALGARTRVVEVPVPPTATTASSPRTGHARLPTWTRRPARPRRAWPELADKATASPQSTR